MPPDHPSGDDSRRLVRDPIYYQLNELLRGLIRKAEFRAGDQFLTERQISARFGVSRVTANKALSHLVVTGMLELRKGVGTFVRPVSLGNDLRSLVSFTQRAARAGKLPTTRVLNFVVLSGKEAGSAICSELKISTEETVVRFDRLRIADSVPVILERRTVVAGRCPDLTAQKVAGSFYSLIEDEMGLRITGADQTIRGVSLSPEDAQLLGVEPGTAALWVHAIGYAGDPLWVEDTLYRGDCYEFNNTLGLGRSSPEPAHSLGERRDFAAFGI